MKKAINQILTLVVMTGMISSATNYAAGRANYNSEPMPKTEKAKIKANLRKEANLNKSLNTETTKLAELEGNPDATQEQIDQQKNKVDAKKEEALSWLQKTYKSATEMSSTAKALVATVAIATAAVTADWYFGTGYAASGYDWLASKMPSRETFGFGKKSLTDVQSTNLADVQLKEFPSRFGSKTPRQLAQEGQKVIREKTGQLYEQGKRFVTQTPEQLKNWAERGSETITPLTQMPLSQIPGRAGRRMVAGATMAGQNIVAPAAQKAITATKGFVAQTPAEIAAQTKEWARQQAEAIPASEMYTP